MKRSSGFTLIELLVTVTIMVILMTLAVANVRSTQVRARDAERKSDAENIARHLDSLYDRGYEFKTNDDITVNLRGSYPIAEDVNLQVSRDQIFSELPRDALIDPSKKSFESNGLSSTTITSTPTTLDAETPYVYQPFGSTGTSICAYDPCTKFNLYYYIEQTPGIPGIIKSKHR